MALCCTDVHFPLLVSLLCKLFYYEQHKHAGRIRCSFAPMHPCVDFKIVASEVFLAGFEGAQDRRRHHTASNICMQFPTETSKGKKKKKWFWGQRYI